MAWWITYHNIRIIQCATIPVNICSHPTIQMLIPCRLHHSETWWIHRWSLDIKWTINNLPMFQWCIQVSVTILCLLFYIHFWNSLPLINHSLKSSRKWFTSTNAYAWGSNVRSAWQHANEWIFCVTWHTSNVKKIVLIWCSTYVNILIFIFVT